MIKESVVVKADPGFDGRPIALLVQEASQYASTVYIQVGEKHINAKSIMGMMSLNLIGGEEITVVTEGEDEEKAAEMVTLYREYFTVTGIFENSVYDGVEEMLKTLKQAGIKIAMATSKPEKFAKIIADHFELAQYFDVIGGACMDETRTEKQDVIRYVLEQCEEKELDKIVMVGDRSYDVVGGHAEGLKVIGVLYGYGDLKELSEAGADALATTPQEVAELVIGSGKRIK